MPGLLDALAEAPRRRLAHLPTPLERCRRLTDALGGPEIWIKRDDCTGLGLGGNKVRKLEFLLGRAEAVGADTIVTFGALQSNHARQTAAACARLGLRCVLVLTTAVERSDDLYLAGGNRLLDDLFGAEVVVVPDDAAAAAAAVETLADRLAAQGAVAEWIPPGGSDAVGTLGYVAAAHEVAVQAHGIGGALTDVVVAVSTGGTQAGLLVGFDAVASAGGAPAPRVTGVAVYHDAPATADTVTALTAAVSAPLGIDPPDAARVVVDGDQLGPGYGQPTDAMREALTLFARCEGIVLDPVYSGKAAAALVDSVRAGHLGPEHRVLFWHTGGAPGLFAYGRDVVG